MKQIELFKICITCNESKAEYDFYFRKDNNSYRKQCKKCWDIKTKSWALNNPDRRKKIANKYAHNNNHKVRIYKAKIRKIDSLKLRKWCLENPEKKKAIDRAWCQKNKGIICAKVRLRQINKVKATPKWANINKIREIYKEANRLGLVVDHIIPLKHPLVCGLHVEGNLQLLTLSENCKKHNKFEPFSKSLI